MKMLSNGYGCIKKGSKTLKQSLFDWILHKFTNLLTRTMSDVPTASTSTASTSSGLTSSQSRNASFRELLRQHFPSDDSDFSSDEETENLYELESVGSNEIECVEYDELDDNVDNSSWSSVVSSNLSVEERISPENSETEIPLKEQTQGPPSLIPPVIYTDDSSIPMLVLIKTPPHDAEYGVEGIGATLINVNEHAKRLTELEKELEFIESSEWMYRPIDSSIR